MYEDYEDLGHFQLTENDDATTIRILQLTDLHFFPKECASFEGVPLVDSYTQCLNLIDQLVRDSQPDVIILTGDIMDGRGPWRSKEAVVECLQDMIPFFHNIPWTFLPGNHDDDHSPWEREDLVAIMKLDGCLQKEAQGFHHTFLLSKQHVKVRLHLFDSGGNHPDKRIMYYCTPPRAIEGFKQFTQQRSNTEPDVTGLVYIHIPTPEYQNIDPVIGENRLFEAAVAAGKVPPPLDKLIWLIKLLRKDRIAGCTRGKDSGLFPALVEANKKAGANIVSLFCGHDHHSDAVFYRKGIFLGYGRSASMTPPYDWEGKAPNPNQRGARVVEVSSNGVTKTWIQNQGGFEDGTLLDMVSMMKRN